MEYMDKRFSWITINVFEKILINIFLFCNCNFSVHFLNYFLFYILFFYCLYLFIFFYYQIPDYNLWLEYKINFIYNL